MFLWAFLAFKYADPADESRHSARRRKVTNLRNSLGRQFVWNWKIEFSIFVEKTSLKLAFRVSYCINILRLLLISSNNIENYNFAILLISARSKDTRFHKNYEVQKTLQNLFKIQNIDAFATSKTLKCSISQGFCRLFRLLGFVVKQLCDSLANFVLLCLIITWNIRFTP